MINLAAQDPALAAAVVAQVPAIDKRTRGMSREAKAKMQREGISLATLIGVSLRSVAAGVDDGGRHRRPRRTYLRRCSRSRRP